MRIFWKECKKFLDVRILLILTVLLICFAVLLIPYQVRERAKKLSHIRFCGLSG